MTNLIPFKFEGAALRVIECGEDTLFVAKDFAEALGYSWAGSATIKHVPDQWKGVNSVQTPSGVQDMAVLTEQGLYFFLNRSDKPKALPLQMWVAGEVLPSIRKTGAYSAPAIDARHDGMAKMTAHKVTVIEKALLQTVGILDALVQRVDGLLVSHDPRVSAFHLTSPREMLDKAGVPSKGRNPLNRKFSHRLPSYAIRHGELPKRCQHSGKFLYSHELAERFMGEVGRGLIFSHMAKLNGQMVIAFAKPGKGRDQ